MADSGKDLSTLGKHLSSLVNTFRRRTTEQHATSSKGVDGTRVDSTIGYQRWVGRPEEGVADVPEESVRLNLSPTTDDHDDANSTEGYEDDDDITSNATSEGEGTIGDADACSEQGSLSLQRAASLHSLEGAQEPATTKVDTIDEWQAGWNITNAIQGMFIVSFPYTVHQGGYWSIFAMIIVAYICCYTGKILVACLYEEQKDGRLVRVRASYADIAARVFGDRFGRPVVNSAQFIELLMTCILYVLLCGDLLKGSFKVQSMPLSAWITIGTVPLLFCAFIKTMRRVSWLSLWCSVAHMLINIIIVIYCLTLANQWQPQAVKINPSIGTMPIALGIIVFSYTSQIFLPTLEGKMIRREKYHCMLGWTHVAAAIFKVVFSYIGFVTWGEDTEEVITNNLPWTLRVIVNLILVAKALLSYPLPYFAAVEIVESIFFQDQAKTPFQSCYRGNMSIKWWGILLRLLLVIVTMLMAIFIPHFAILMGLIGSFTGMMLSFVWPCIFYLYIKRDTIRWPEKLLNMLIIFLGVLFGLMGLYSSSSALVRAVKEGHSSRHVSNMLSEISEKATNETLKSTLLG